MNFMIAVLVAMSVVTAIGTVANVGLILMAEEKRDLILPAIFSVLLVLLGYVTGRTGEKTNNALKTRTNVESCECQKDENSVVESSIPEKAEDLGNVDNI